MNDLFERALALAFDRLGSGHQMLPFALVVAQGGTTECLTIGTDRSDKAAYLGRRLVRERATLAAEVLREEGAARNGSPPCTRC